MILRTELFDHYRVFDVVNNGEHYYVYGLPYYEEVQSGRLSYPDGYDFYIISGDSYAKLMVAKQAKFVALQRMVYEMTDSMLSGDDRYVCIGNSKDFLGSELSCVMQAFVKYLAQNDALKKCCATVS